MRVREVKAPRLIAGRFSRAERRRQRKAINLDDAALTWKTQHRYYIALRKIVRYVEQAKTEDQLDGFLCNWVRKMWREGEPLLTIGDALSALHFYQPWTRRKIPHAWKLFATWRKIEVPSRAPPLTWEITQSMAAYEWEHGHYEMATILLVAFHCLLRTGEFLQVTAGDISLGEESGIISLKGTKTGLRSHQYHFTPCFGIHETTCRRSTSTGNYRIATLVAKCCFLSDQVSLFNGTYGSAKTSKFIYFHIRHLMKILVVILTYHRSHFYLFSLIFT